MDSDNRLAENAGWDRELLGLELQYLTDLDVDFDVTLWDLSFPRTPKSDFENNGL